MTPAGARWLALCGATFCVLAWGSNGLVAGAGDQGIHEVFVASAGGSDAFAGDLLSDSASRHPSAFFAGIAVLRRWADPRWLALGGVLAMWIAVGAAVGALARGLGANRVHALLAVAATAPAQLVLGGAPTLDPLLLPRGVALPVEIAAVLCVVHRGWPLAFALAGLSVAIHAPSGVVVVVGVAWAWLPARRDAWTAPLWTLLGLIPALLLARHSVDGLRVPAELWPAVEARLSHHLLPAAFPASAWALAALWCAGAWLGTRGRPALRRFLVATLAWAVLAGVAGPALRIRLLLNLEPWQAMRLVAVLTPALLLASLRFGRRAEVFAGLVLLVACGWLSPPPWRTGPPTPVLDLGNWARQNTAPGTLFVLPPDLAPGFRPAAQRPTYGTWKDGGELQFDPALAREWTRRMRRLCACDPLAELPSEDARFATSRAAAARVGQRFDRLTDAAVLSVAAEAGAAYVVRRGAGPGAPVGPFRVVPVP